MKNDHGRANFNVVLNDMLNCLKQKCISFVLGLKYESFMRFFLKDHTNVLKQQLKFGFIYHQNPQREPPQRSVCVCDVFLFKENHFHCRPLASLCSACTGLSSTQTYKQTKHSVFKCGWQEIQWMKTEISAQTWRRSCRR